MGFAGNGQKRMFEKGPSFSAFIDAQMEKAIGAVGIGQDFKADGIAGDIADKGQGRLVTDQFAIGLDLEMGKAVFPEGAADGPDIIGMGDMAGTTLVDQLDDLGIEANADDGGEDPAVDPSEIEVSQESVFQTLDGGLHRAVQTQLGGEEVFGAAGENQDGGGGAGHGLQDGADGAVSAGDDNNGSV